MEKFTYDYEGLDASKKKEVLRIQSTYLGKSMFDELQVLDKKVQERPKIVAISL